MSNWQRKYFEEICKWAKFDTRGFSDDEVTNIINKSFERTPLTDKEREVVDACIIGGMSQTDCAKKLGVSKSSVFNRLVAIRRKIIEWSGIHAGFITITSDEYKHLTLYAAGLEKQICRELSRAGIHFVNQLTLYTEEEVYKSHRLGPVHFNKLKEFMQEHNLEFSSDGIPPVYKYVIAERPQ